MTERSLPQRSVPEQATWRSRLPSPVRVGLLVAEGLAGCLLLAGIGLHLTIRDAMQPAAAIWYGLPTPVLAAISVGGLLVSGGRPIWRVAALGVTVWAAAMSVSIGPGATAVDRAGDRTGFRLMAWNTYNDSWAGDDSAGVTALIDAYRPDVAVILECGLGGDRHRFSTEGWKRRLPDYQTNWLGNRFLALDRQTTSVRDDRHRGGPPAPSRDAIDELAIAEAAPLPLPPGGSHRCLRVRVPDAAGTPQTITVVVVHSVSDPLVDRRPIYTELARQIDALAAAGPTILCGDFNLPSDSLFVQPLRRRMRLASEVAPGVRYRPTWPGFAPVLELDQVWVSDHFEVTSCESPLTTASDHQPVVVDLVLRTGPR